MKTKKAIYCWFILLIFSTAAIFANQSREKLEKKLQTASDKEKIEILNKLANTYLSTSVEKALQYGKQALKLSRKHNDKWGEAAALLNIGIGYCQSGHFEIALENAQQSLKIFEDIDYKSAVYECLINIGNMYILSNNYKKALEYYLKSLKKIEELGEKGDIAIVYGNIGSVYSKLCDYHKALEYQLQALEIREKNGDKKGIAASYHNIGNIYGKIENNEKALEYYQKALLIKKEIGSEYEIASSLATIGVIHTNLKNYDKALEHLQESLKIQEKIGNRQWIPSALINIGNVYSYLNDHEKALEYYRRTLKMGEKNGMPDDIASAMISIGRISLLRNEYDNALPFLKKGLKIAEENKIRELVKPCYFNLSEVYAGKRDYKKALDYYKMFVKKKDDMFNEKVSRQITEMQTRYDTLKKEKEIESLKKNNQIQQLMLNRQKFIRNVSIVILILVLIIFFQLFTRYRYLFAFWKKKNYIAHYRLLDKISSGGMGNIYRARDCRGKSRNPTWSGTCAIKVLKDEYYNDEKYKRRFKNEAALMDQLQHPNIVKVMERGEYEGNLYIAMELLEGQTLAELLDKQGKIELKMALSVMMQTVEALKEIHKRGIIHRDLKPENIMIIQAEHNPAHVKVLDFGLARTQNLSRMTRSGMIMGTIFYVPPEQLSRSTVLAAGDIYSLGIIYYQLLTGDKPFSGESAFEIAKQILQKEPFELKSFQPGIPTVLSTLIKQMIDKEPRQRPSANEILTTLTQVEKSIEESNTH